MLSQGTSGGTKARTAPALVPLGSVWGNHGAAQPLQPQETLLHQERILRRFSCHRLECGNESVQRQQEKERGHCESHSSHGAPQVPINEQSCSCQLFLGRATLSPGLCCQLRGLHRGSLLAQTLECVPTALEPAVLMVKKTGSYSPGLLVE